MAAFCINTHSQEFRDAAKRLGVSQFELEQIAYKYGNQKGTFGQFPSDDYIKEQLNGVPNYNATEAQAKLWKLRYSTPREFDTLEELNAAKKDALQYFNDSSVHSFVNADGKYELRVAEQDNEYQRIKEQAIADGTFMKAPNGNQSNLNEQQWLQVRTKAFKRWFGDWENDPTNASKVVDENGEPLVVYHGGAPNIEVFRVGSPETTTTGYGTYTEKETGRKIPVDSARTIFFSSNPFVGQSYAQLYALQYFKDLRHKVQNMIGNLHDDVAGFSRDDFKSFDEFYDFLTIISEYNPRFAKLRDYIKELQQKGEKLKPNEIAAARQLFIDLRSVLKEYTEDWNLVSSEWDNILTIGKSIIKEYLGGKYYGDNIYRLMRGEIPEYMRKEWELFTKIRKHREKYGLPPIGNYDQVHVWLSSGQSFTDSDYVLKYDGKELIFDETRGKRDVPVSQMSFDEIRQFLQMAGHANQYSLWERDDDRVKHAFREKSGYYPVFLNIRSPFEHDYEGTHMGQGYKQSPKTSFGYVAARQVDKAIRDGNDGVVYRNLYDPYLADNYGVFSPNQIKSAERNIGAFSTRDNNIYNEHEIVSDRDSLQDARLNALREEFGINPTVSQLLSLVGEDSKYSGIISLLKTKKDGRIPLLSNVKVHIWDSNYTGNFRGRRAYYDADTNTININSSTVYKGGRADSVIMHEVMHAITVNRIIGNTRFRNEFDKIIAKYLQQFPEERGKYGKESFGKSNPHYMEEFIADVWSNQNTINNLRSIKSIGKTTLWDRIKQFFVKIFAGSKGTLMADASDAIYRLLDSPEIVRSRDTYYEGESSFIQSPINIWAGSGEHSDLSNFALRPFKIPKEFVLPNGTFVHIPQTLLSVEAAFQALKDNYSFLESREDRLLNGNLQRAIIEGRADAQGRGNSDVLEGKRLRRLGRQFKGLDREAWDKDRFEIMKSLIKMSFEQNPKALQKLLDTGDAPFSHRQENSIWETEFPRILMEVREELRKEQGTALGKQVATQGTTQQYGVVIDSQLKSNYTQWQQQNPNGLVAYRVHFEIVSPTDHHYNRASEAESGWIGNPYSEGEGQTNKGVDTVQRFFDWLTTGNNFGEPLATEEYRQAIIQKLLNTPVGTPILYYKELGRPSHATVLGYLINHKELIGDQQVTTTPETASQEEPMWSPPKVERAFHEREETIVTKMDNLLNSGNMTVTEVMMEANKAMDWISDQLTQYLEDPEIVWSKYKSSEDKNDVVARVSKMSRKELVDYIGVQNIINIYAAEVISPTQDTVNADGTVTKGNKELFDALGRQGRANYRLIKANIDGLIQYGYTRFLAREGFGFKLSDVEGQTYTTTDEVSPEDRVNVDDYTSYDGTDTNEEVRNQQDHWQIENATRDIMDNASVKVKQAISDCYILQDNGKVKEDGTPDYDIATDNLNRNERVNPIHAVRSIVTWTQGATKLSQMIDKLKAQQKNNPWISQIIARLEDRTGEESDFQSQFFNTFSKHFQSYSIVKMNAKGGYYTMQVNDHPALKDAIDNVVVQRKTGGWPLVNENGVVNASALATYKGFVDTLSPMNMEELNEENRKGAVEMIGGILTTLGLPQAPETIDRILTDKLKNDIWTNANNILKKLSDVVEKGVNDYNPFEYSDDYGIRNFISKIFKPFTNLLEETMVSSVFDSGKMYQSFITPSWTTKLFQKMHLPDKEFREFILDEFGNSEWFVEPDTNMLEDLSQEELQGLSDNEREARIRQAKIDYISTHDNIWRTPWLGTLMRMSQEQREEAFQHKVQLNFNKQNYMRGMDDLTYVLSVFSEYFGERATVEKGGYFFANYRFPMLSNKPSNEFVKFVRYTGIGTTEYPGRGAQAILNGYIKIFRQELSRIQTVEIRSLKEGDEGYIANFDANEGKGSGLRFTFLDFLNEYLNGAKKNDSLGQLLDRKLHAEGADTALTSEENTELENKVKKEIAKHLNSLADNLIGKYKANGLFESLKNIEGVGKTDYEVESAIREFAWNDHFAQANLLQILVTDKAFYKNEEDLQKRLAQVHSPGIRGNWEAFDFGERDEKGQLVRAPQKVSDGKLRVVKLNDFIAKKELVGNIIANLESVFDKKIEDAPEDEKQALKDLKDNIIDAYGKVNVVDGQAFVSPTAYRKKAIAFGEWTKDDEKVYKDLMDGKFNMAQVQKVFNPRKPFTYGKTTKRSNPELNTPIKNLRYGVQYKDSEYLLIMADALLRGQNTGRPNLLGAIFDVMEESYKTDPTQGIDFFVFESGVKTGLMGPVSINEFINVPDGQRLAKEKLEAFIYQEGKVGGAYNENYVDVLDAEDYTTQQTVPEHFMHGDLQWGSQIRALMPSDLETSYNGQPVVYEYQDPVTGETIQKSAEELRKEWEENTAKMVNQSVDEIRKELGLVKGMSVADSNVLISKILQREILSNPRYGVDLLLACSVDANGNFRIPLGDPIQSKRVEQLLSSIIKNRINKQKVAGGTLVEVTNFGTSRRLNIRFKDKNDATGKRFLDTMDEYLAKGHTEKEFKEYIKENQGGIAYYECYAPAWTRDLFLKFADEKGNIDVEAIEMLDPDLLKMYGYRIPTEDKYSTAPYKIVGFLPQEAGDGFMQPWETTVIDGSDFDVDKKNLMRMVLDIETKVLSKKEFFEQKGYTEETEENLKEYAKYRSGLIGARAIYNKLGDAGNISITKEEAQQIEWYTESKRKRDLDVVMQKKISAEEDAIEDVDFNDSLTKTYTTFYGKEVKYQSLQDTINELESREELTSADEKRIEKYKNALKKIENKYSEREREIERKSKEYKEKDVLRAKRDKKIAIVNQILREGVFRSSESIPASQRKLFLAVKKAYIESLFSIKRPEVGTKGYYNNKMFNMQWAIATHASTADKMLNPGNFDEQKRVGYMVEANRLGYSWNALQGKTISELKDLVFTQKNLMDFDVQTQFYKQNSVAGQVLGIFAVAKSAHAMFEGRNYGVLVERPFYIDGMEFFGAMHYDQKYDRTGTTLIGKTLGSLVGASADAVKDPVLNLMNINKETINVLNTALRLGLDFETAALLLSSKVVGNVLETYRRNSLTRKTSFDKEIKAVLRELEKKEYIGKDSPLQRQNLSNEEMIWAINGLRIEEPTVEEQQKSDEITYKVLNAVLGLSEISKKIQPLTDLSRLNSITSAPGPLYIDTITSDRKLGPAVDMGGIVKFYTDSEGTEQYQDATRGMVFDELKSLEAFYESYNVTKELFERLKFTTATKQFAKLLGAVPASMQFSLYSNGALMKSLADFFQSYLLVQSGAIKASELKRYTTEFVKDYMEGKLTQSEKVKNNPLIQAIQPKLISKEGETDRFALSIDTTGMEQAEKDALSAGWAQLEKDDPELSHKLFAYNFFRGGIGFNPKSFMALVPIQVKEQIGGYIETFTNIPSIGDYFTVVDQWARNNWGNKEIVTRITNKPCDENTTKLKFSGRYEMNNVYNSYYIRVITKDGEFMFREVEGTRSDNSVEYEKVMPLGNNKEYVEMYPTDAEVKASEDTRSASLETQELEAPETREDNPEVPQTSEEQTRDLTDFYQTAYSEEGAQEGTNSRMEEYFDKANNNLDIQTNKDKFDEIMSGFCSSKRK